MLVYCNVCMAVICVDAFSSVLSCIILYSCTVGCVEGGFYPIIAELLNGFIRIHSFN